MPESTLRTWKAKAEKLGPEGEKEPVGAGTGRAGEADRVEGGTGRKAWHGANRSQAGSGTANMQRCDEIDRILLGSEKSEGLVLWGDTAVDEQRQRTKLDRDLRERLRTSGSSAAASSPGILRWRI